jgi:hypothetical protein
VSTQSYPPDPKRQRLLSARQRLTILRATRDLVTESLAQSAADLIDVNKQIAEATAAIARLETGCAAAGGDGAALMAVP